MAVADYFLVCAPGECTAPDGTTQPVGTAVGHILYDPAHEYTPPEGMALVPAEGFTGTVYQPIPPPPTTIGALAFIRRFTATEQGALMAVDPLWPVMIAAAGIVNVTDPTLTADLAQAVAGGLLTQARVAQILNLSAVSP